MRALVSVGVRVLPLVSQSASDFLVCTLVHALRAYATVPLCGTLQQTP